jgi:hypothetical protein
VHSPVSVHIHDDGHEKLPAGGQIGARWRS